jgi:hypothetical protein
MCTPDCVGGIGVVKKLKRETKPAISETPAPVREQIQRIREQAPPAAETASPAPAQGGVMPQGKKAEQGTCTRCSRGPRPLGNSAGWEGAVCRSCQSMVQKWTREGKPIPPFTGKTLSKGSPGKVSASAKPRKPASAPAEPAAPKEPRPKAIAPPRPVAAPPAPLPSAVDTGHATGHAIVLRITCHEKADIVRVLAATEGLSVHVGLEPAT